MDKPLDSDYNLPQTEFSAGRARIAYACVEDLISAIPKSKRLSVLGPANDLFLFIDAAGKVAAARTESKM